MKTFETPKGTKLPLMDLHGRDYLQTAFRVQWFREDHKHGKIQTEIVKFDDKSVTFCARIFTDVGHELANAHKTILIKSTLDIEKAETGAIGRALALCGYGTQFAGKEIDEGDDLADAPIGEGMPSFENFDDLPKEPPPPQAKNPPRKGTSQMSKDPAPQGWPKEECNHKWMDDKYNISQQYCYSCGAHREKKK